MRNILTLLLILLPFFLFAQTGGVRPSITGKRADQTVSCFKSPPLDSVEIICYIPGTNDTFRGITDSTDNLAIKHMPAGVYTIAAKLPGYLPSEYKGVIVGEMKYTYLCFEMIPVVAQDNKSKKKSKKKTGK